MSFKYRNFQKQMNVNYQPNLEGLAIEVSVGVIFSIIAYYCYNADMMIIAVPLGLLALACVILSLYSFYSFAVSFLRKRTLDSD